VRTHAGPKGSRKAKEAEPHGSVVATPKTDVQRLAAVSLKGRSCAPPSTVVHESSHSATLQLMLITWLKGTPVPLHPVSASALPGFHVPPSGLVALAVAQEGNPAS